jgi:hypothetical protein
MTTPSPSLDLTTIVVAAIAGLPATIAALAGLLVSLRNHRKLAEVADATNGLSTTAIDAAHTAGLTIGRAEGHEQGEREEHDRQLERSKTNRRTTDPPT